MNAKRQSIEVVVPGYNEAATLTENVGVLLGYLLREFPFAFTVTIADNASTDDTPVVGARLAASHEAVGYVRLEEKGRGRALRETWRASDADIVAYMDVDLSTNLESFLPLVAPIMSGHSAVAIGTRLVHQAHVRRRLKRELLSRGYNGLRSTGPGSRLARRSAVDHRRRSRRAVAAPSGVPARCRSVAAMGGFTGRETVLSRAYLASLVASGEARYFLLGGSVGFGGATTANRGVEAITSTCSAVATSRWSTQAAGGALYDCAGQAAEIADAS